MKLNRRTLPFLFAISAGITLPAHAAECSAVDGNGAVAEPVEAATPPAIAKCSPDTALRDISELVTFGVLKKSAAGGRSTSYELAD